MALTKQQSAVIDAAIILASAWCAGNRQLTREIEDALDSLAAVTLGLAAEPPKDQQP